MADLDDFFAKKDRKKSKSRKFATTEEVAKKLEDTSKKQDKQVKKGAQEGGDEASGQDVHDQDEWKDFEEEKKDYTGLKIGNLTLNPEQEANTGSGAGGGGADGAFDAQQTTYDEAGNEVLGEKRAAGPWRRMHEHGGDQQQSQPTQKPDEKPAEPAPAANTPNVVGGAYVPPGKRQQQTQVQQPLQGGRLRSKVAPDIHNEEFFPTLASTKAEQKRGRNEGSFEVVSHNKSNSLRYVEQTKSSGQAQKLSLGNRYNTLSNDS